MADQEETQSGEGSGVESQQTVTEPNEQSSAQSQESEQQSQVGTAGTETSSKGSQGRSNASWAQNRIVERTISKLLDQRLGPVLERLEKIGAPPASSPAPAENGLGEPDYNNLSAWLINAVEKIVEGRLPKHLGQFEKQLQSASKTQEARNYLLSQEDIGTDEAKLEEIQQVIKDHMLEYALDTKPLQAVQLAVKIWRDSKRNPNAPTKDQLSGAGGSGAAQRTGGFDLQKMAVLRDKLTQNLTIDERAKVESELNQMVAQFK